MIKNGDIVIIKKNTSGHNYAINVKYEVISNNGLDSWILKDLVAGVQGNYIRDCDFNLIYNKDKNIKDIELLEKELSSIKDKRNFMLKNELKSMDPNTFTLNKIIEISNFDLSIEDKFEKLKYLIEKEYDK